MNTQIMVVGSAKTKDIKRRRPRIRLSGFWLNDIGFTVNSLVSADYKNGNIALKVEGTGVDTYNRVVKELLLNSLDLLLVKNEYNNRKLTPHLEIMGFWLEELNFKVGSVMVIKSEQGAIHIKILDIDSLESKNAAEV